MRYQIYSHRFRRLERELRDGPIGQFVDDVATSLLDRGYPRTELRSRFTVVAMLSRWLISNSLGLVDLDERKIQEFVRYRREITHGRMSSQGEMITLAMFIDAARAVEAVPPAEPVERPVDRFDEILTVYEAHQTHERGLALPTLAGYVHHIRLFLEHLFEDRPLDVTAISADDIVTFILGYTGERPGGDASPMICAIRSFLRFLVFQGHVRSGLVDCVPGVASRRHKRLPSHLSEGELKQLLDSCSRAQRSGDRRDYAILLLLARLGLRASEVSSLRLEDIDWERGQLTIQGKGNRQSLLPLPKDVGKAIVAYLKDGRPRCSSREVFVGTRAPYRRLKAGSVVSSIVHRAVERAGLNPERKGAHLLRHTLATECLRQGATLGEIGRLLRHAHIDTTTIYAKVDYHRLALVAVPWPEDLWMGGSR